MDSSGHLWHRYILLVMPSPWLISAKSALRSSTDKLEKSTSGSTGGGGGMPPGGGGGAPPLPTMNKPINTHHLTRYMSFVFGKINKFGHWPTHHANIIPAGFATAPFVSQSVYITTPHNESYNKRSSNELSFLYITRKGSVLVEWDTFTKHTVLCAS